VPLGSPKLANVIEEIILPSGQDNCNLLVSLMELMLLAACKSKSVDGWSSDTKAQILFVRLFAKLIFVGSPRVSSKITSVFLPDG
jgi:hypothetical protein